MNFAFPFTAIKKIAQDKILGRVSAGTGKAELIDCTAAGRALIDDADAAAQRATLGLGTAATANKVAAGQPGVLDATASIPESQVTNLATDLGAKIGGSTGGADNAVLRADGTGGKTSQSSAVVIDDTGNVGCESVQSPTGYNRLLLNNGVAYFYSATAVIVQYWSANVSGFFLPVNLASYTVATLPSPTAGNLAFATNLTALTNGSVAAGGGSLKGVVKGDGTNWIVVG